MWQKLYSMPICTERKISKNRWAKNVGNKKKSQLQLIQHNLYFNLQEMSAKIYWNQWTPAAEEAC